MCKRNTGDPLLKVLLEKYQLHLLSIPRESADIGDVYIEQGPRVGSAGTLSHLLDPPMEPPKHVRNELLSDIGGCVSGSVEAGAGLGLLENFVQALGGGAASGNLRASYAAKGTRLVRFRFTDVRRDHADVLELGNQLAGHQLRIDHPLLDPKAYLYVTTGVLRASSIAVQADGGGGQKVDIDVDVLATAEARASVKIERSAKGEVVYTGKRRLAFGIELYELSYESETRRFRLVAAAKPLTLRGSTSPKRRWIGGPDGDAFITVG